MDAKPPLRSPTVTDVAAAAGVSPMTVSRVLNGRGGAGEETRQRVLEAAQALNYRPNAFAQSLKSDRSNTVGIVVPDIVNPFFPEIIRGAELVARPAGYTLLSCNVVEDPEREEEVLGTLLDRRVDGVIICSARLDEERLLRAIAPHRAVVLINRSVAKRYAGTIEVDYRAGVEAAVSSLIAQGRRRFVFAAGPAYSHGGRKRREGVEAVLSRHGLALVHDLSCTPDLQGGIELAGKLVPRAGEIDAVICYNDLIALGLMKPFETAGISVPDQVAIVGCDDIPAASLVTPPLTTLRIAKQDLGEMAMRMLLDRIAGRNAQQGIVIEPDLILRSTTPSDLVQEEAGSKLELAAARI
ncbi:LacI family transcriptional regulator [Bosea caraganae]|uniref:LacI family transcriptional regulator n=1 Tax=Bosea caraganae TaxID=2763117 RepID=A0A370KYW7_9HYPH|nr:LacI family DNA-binding transcriptional regulator [Bosea caraganae]RDJ19802.1 LacI family transcriptional regulator [Bosea caraganae]RDJ30059.1 LacI family transcriptional regulator [Bosea caraganae]